MEKGKHNFKSVYTFKLIPNDDGVVKTIHFPKYAIKAMALFVFILFLTSCYFISSFIVMKVKYVKNNEDLALLEEVNQKQRKEINELKEFTEGIQEKLDSLSELESEVKDLVGLPGSQEEDQSLTASNLTQDEQDQGKVSRGSFFSRSRRTSHYDQREDLEQIGNVLKHIDSSLSRGKDDLINLKEDVVNQLNYLDAKPDFWPNNGRISSPFGNRRSPTGGASTFHRGIDIANSYGSPVYAAGSGRVIFSGWRSGTGRTIIISHGYGYRTLYAHNSSLLVQEGDRVKKGQMIAKLGSSGISTGPHVHFEVHINGNPVNPVKVLK